MTVLVWVPDQWAGAALAITGVTSTLVAVYLEVRRGRR